MIKRHTRPNPPRTSQGGISEREASIHISNVMLVDPDSNVRTQDRPPPRLRGQPGARRQEERRASWRRRAQLELDSADKDEMAARLRDNYSKEVAPALRKEFGIDNPMAVPRLEKIVLNMGLGEAVGNPKMLDAAAEELTAIAGQKPIVTQGQEVDRDLQAPRRACRSARG